MGKLNDILTAIDLIATDLNANVALPTHETWKYTQHPALQPKVCPLLAVFLEVSRWDLVATGPTYVLRPAIGVGWYIGTPEEDDQAGVGLDAKVHEAAVVADLISTRLESYANGLPAPLTGKAWGALSATEPATSEGMTTGFVHRLIVETF